MNNNMQKVGEMLLVTGGGWIFSLSNIEIIARIISLIVPTVLSILIYLHKKKKK